MAWSWSLYFGQQVVVHVGGLSGVQDIVALRDRRAAISLGSCAPQHALYVDNVACTGLNAKQVQLGTYNIAETARAANLAVFPVTTKSSKEECLSISFIGIHW